MVKEGLTIYEVSWSLSHIDFRTNSHCVIERHKLFLFKKDAEDFKQNLLEAEKLLEIPPDGYESNMSRIWPVIIEREVSKNG